LLCSAPPRIFGRVQKAIRRALHAAGELTTSELREWAYEEAKPWQIRWIRRSARKVAEPAGRRGRETLWRLKPEDEAGV